MIRRPDDFNIVSGRKQRKIRGMEITTDTIDKPKIKATPAPSNRKKKKIDTRGKRLDDWVKKYPNADIWYCRVDIDSEFEYFGRRFRLDDTLSEYAGIAVGKDDVFYPMDQVIVVDTGNGLVFLNQSAELIDREQVKEVR